MTLRITSKRIFFPKSHFSIFSFILFARHGYPCYLANSRFSKVNTTVSLPHHFARDPNRRRFRYPLFRFQGEPFLKRRERIRRAFVIAPFLFLFL